MHKYSFRQISTGFDRLPSLLPTHTSASRRIAYPERSVISLKFAVTGIDERFRRLRELLLADGHSLVSPREADMVVPPPWEKQAVYTRRESYQVANAALTAQGARELLEKAVKLPAKVLVLGFGRVGKLCAMEFQRSGAAVTVAARSSEALSWAEAMGFAALDITALSGQLAPFAAVVNTVPAPVLTESLLGELNRDTYLLELASAPGGIDAAAAKERGLRCCRAPGLPGTYAPERAALLLRDALYEVIAQPKPRLGLAVTGSHCCLDKVLTACARLREAYELVPVISETADSTDTRFGTAASFRKRLEELCGSAAVDSIAAAEPLGTREALDALLVAPCTGNTLGKLAHGITDTTVTMACKAHLRNGRPLILAISTNDGLSGSAGSIAALLQRKNVYFVPFAQDDPEGKPCSLQADFSQMPETVAAALAHRQLQPLLL